MRPKISNMTQTCPWIGTHEPELSPCTFFTPGFDRRSLELFEFHGCSTSGFHQIDIKNLHLPIHCLPRHPLTSCHSLPHFDSAFTCFCFHTGQKLLHVAHCELNTPKRKRLSLYLLFCSTKLKVVDETKSLVWKWAHGYRLKQCVYMDLICAH